MLNELLLLPLLIQMWNELLLLL